MNNNNGWRLFFNNHAPQYMDNCFTKNTIAEVDFIEEEFQLKKGASILDVGCGTGRHSVELAKRGYHVTGIDISENMIKEAQRTCQLEQVEVEFIYADATEFIVDKSYDACICLCEGAFGLLSMDEDPFDRDVKILKNINAALKEDAKFLLTALNGLRKIRKYSDEDVASGRFDPFGIAEIYPLTNLIAEAPPNIMVKEKGFITTELVHLLKVAGFSVDHIWGGTAGAWNRQPLKMDEMELMVISRKVKNFD